MYDETNVPLPEYQVRPVVRYVVTRYCFPFQHSSGGVGMSGSSEVMAEVDNEQRAYQIASALRSFEADERARMQASAGCIAGPA